MKIGSEEYLQVISVPAATVGMNMKLFSEMYEGAETAKSMRQNEFYSSIYKKLKRCLTVLSMPNIPEGQSNADLETALAYPKDFVPIADRLHRETTDLSFSTQWLFDQTLNDSLIGHITTAIFPKFLYEIFDQMKHFDSKYEENEFRYLYYLAVIKPLLEVPAVGANYKDKMKSTMARWWLFYVIDTLQDECRAAATDFINRLEIASASTQITNLVVYEAAKKAVFKLRNAVTVRVKDTLKEGTGNAIYDYVRRYLNEVCIIRNAHSEMGRLELKIENDENSAVYKFIITDKSKWVKHTKRIANSFSHQMYHMTPDGTLEPQLETREIASFITSHYAFSSGVESRVEKDPSVFMDLAVDPRLYIDVSRISSYINENGMNLPNMIESLAIIYSTSMRDVWFSFNQVQNFGSPVKAIDLQHQMEMSHLTKVGHIVNYGTNFDFDGSMVTELALKISQRFWALVIPETSVTGNYQITYDNAFGTPLISGIAAESNSWFSSTLVKGLDVTLYNNVVPIISFLKSMRIDDINIDRENNLIVGKELLLNMYQIFKTFGLEDLKTQMVPWKANLAAFPSDRDVYPEWTSAIGQSNATKRFNGYGDLIKEQLCLKSIFSQTNSSQMNSALVKALSILISYNTSAIPATTIMDIVKE